MHKTTLTEVFTHYAPVQSLVLFSLTACVCVCVSLCYTLQRCQSHLGAAAHLGQSETVQIDIMQKHLKRRIPPIYICDYQPIMSDAFRRFISCFVTSYIPHSALQQATEKEHKPA